MTPGPYSAQPALNAPCRYVRRKDPVPLVPPHGGKNGFEHVGRQASGGPSLRRECHLLGHQCSSNYRCLGVQQARTLRSKRLDLGAFNSQVRAVSLIHNFLFLAAPQVYLNNTECMADVDLQPYCDGHKVCCTSGLPWG